MMVRDEQLLSSKRVGDGETGKQRGNCRRMLNVVRLAAKDGREVRQDHIMTIRGNDILQLMTGSLSIVLIARRILTEYD